MYRLRRKLQRGDRCPLTGGIGGLRVLQTKQPCLGVAGSPQSVGGQRKGGQNSQPYSPFFPDRRTNLLRICAWNIWTLNWSGPWISNYDFKPRKTVFLGNEFSSLDMDIVRNSSAWLGQHSRKGVHNILVWQGGRPTTRCGLRHQEPSVTARGNTCWALTLAHEAETPHTEGTSYSSQRVRSLDGGG